MASTESSWMPTVACLHCSYFSCVQTNRNMLYAYFFRLLCQNGAARYSFMLAYWCVRFI